MKKTTILKLLLGLSIVLSVIAIVIGGFLSKANILFAIIVFVILTGFSVFVLFDFEKIKNKEISTIEENLDGNVLDVMKVSNVGVLMYDNKYEITWVSSLFKERQIDHTGEKILAWLPKLESVMKTGSGSEVVIINDKKYRVSCKDNSSTLLFKDITNEYNLTIKNIEIGYVLGLLSFDNYDETSESEEDISEMNANIKAPVFEYFKKYNIESKTLRNNRVLLILNEKQYSLLLEDRFSILEKVRKESKKADWNITLSIAFARGSESFVELSNLVSELLDIAQTRGGDQVVSRIVGQDAQFFGGNSEAREKHSKVKVRAIAQSLKELVKESSNVIIAGHLNADADSIGSSICMSTLISSMGIPTYVIYKNNSVDPMISNVLEKYKDDLLSRHHFIDEAEAYNLMDDKTLIIMVDHHNPQQSFAKSLLEEAKNIVIFDHHRRSADLKVDPLLLYVEASASSTCELVSEFIPYIQRRSSMNSTEANIMYLGILIDTNHFRARTGSRTFEACRNLREYGAEPMLCEKLLQTSFNEVKEEAEIVNNAQKYSNKILISAMESGIYSRTIASKAADSMIQTSDIDAVFVICETADDTIITARSNGNVNVQVIMEAMQGGGHMTAAGLQRKNERVINMKKELISVLNTMLKEVE